MPLTVCIDCCVQLNQCSEFYEKTNKAQTSLRQLVINPKLEPHSVEENINYINKSGASLKKEQITERVVDCFEATDTYLNNTDIDNNSENLVRSIDINNSVEIGSTVEIPSIYFADGPLDAKSNFKESEKTLNENKNKRCKSTVKKNWTKPSKKRVKKRNQSPKMVDEDFDITSDMDEELNELDVKSNTKIPDNYMTG